MKVIDLSYSGLEDVCKGMAENIMSDSEFQFDIAIGIASGGIPVAKLLTKYLNNIPVVHVRASRTTTSMKSASVIKQLILRLPRPVLNLLRVIEHFVQVRNPSAVDRNISVEADTLKVISSQSVQNILIVDDAVDSGRSLAQVVNFIRKHNQNCHIATCAVVVTSLARTAHKPDYFKYSDVLIRFPWAADAKQ